MDAPELAAFVAVADEGSFSLAAERLHLTQSAVSRRIAALEGRLELRLFDRLGQRSARPVVLTEAGRTLLPRARRILTELEEARSHLRGMAGEVRGPLTLATSHHIGLHRLPPVLRDFSERFPEVELDLRFLDSEAAHELLLRGELELAVVTLAPGGVPKLEASAVWHDPLAFAVARGDPLGRGGRPTLRELAARRAVLPGPTTYTGRIVTSLFEQHGLRLTRPQTTNYLETIQMMAGIGLGWTVLPERMVTGELAMLSPRDTPRIARTLGWVRHPARSASNAARAFLDVLAEHADG